MWDRRQGPGPVTDFRAADGLETFEVRCGTCGRHFKRREDKLGVIIQALAAHQGIGGSVHLHRVRREQDAGGVRRTGCGRRVFVKIRTVYRSKTSSGAAA
jgi:DNA-directed RNA polymerase subunit RPC12/RpoP